MESLEEKNRTGDITRHVRGCEQVEGAPDPHQEHEFCVTLAVPRRAYHH